MRNIEHSPPKIISSPLWQRGVSMIEVLITLVILSVGLMSVASLQLIASFANKEALTRTHAVMLADQLAERLRTSTVASATSNGFVVHNNYFDMNNYNFNNLSCQGLKTPYECHCLNVPAKIPDCQTINCDASDIAIFDAYQMSCSLVRQNPNATISLTCEDTNKNDSDSCTAGSLQNIMVRWPAQSWRDDVKVTNDNCNKNTVNEYDCVLKRIVL